MHGIKTYFTQRIFHFAFDAAVKNGRSRICTQRTDHEKPLYTCLFGSAREIHDKFKVNLPKRRLRSGFFDRCTEATVRIVRRRECGQFFEIHDKRGEFAICPK